MVTFHSSRFASTYMYFQVGIALHHFGIPLPHKVGFDKVKNFHVEIAYYSI